MATTTPNFGWPVPTSTDLVKNGATAIEALGDAIDASLVDLEGGTTGQVLAKASNTDMDFAWVAQDDSNAIQNTIVDAKGDLIAASAADVPARLAVGSNGETLVADSSTSTGLRYQAPKTQNAIYNSGFDIAQRGTSFTGLNAVDYTLDRWVLWSTVGGQSNYASQQSVGNLSVTPNQAIRYCGRFGRTSGTTNTGGRQIFQTLETADSIRFAGQTVTFSFYGRAGANYSATSNALSFTLTSGTGTDQISYSFTGALTVATATATLTTSWQRFSVTGTVGTSATELSTIFSYTPTGTAGAADYFEITGVQLEVGSVATPFNRMSGTIQGELAACQRYYERITADTAYGTIGTGISNTTTTFTSLTPFKVTKRVTPTAIDTSAAGGFQVDDGANGYTASALIIGAAYNSTQWGAVAVTTSGMTQYRAGWLVAKNTSTAYVGFSSEL